MNADDAKYQTWIDEHYPTPERARCSCEVATQEIFTRFPELKIVRGQILVEEPYNLPPTKTHHWWCVTPSGEVIDPTAHQYPTRILSYESIDESKGELTGKCMNCGDICYNGSRFCKKKCESEFMESLK